MSTLRFTNEWGEHLHENFGPPYDHTAPVTCAACIRRLDSVMNEWLEVLNKRHKLPPNFWDGFKFSWQ